MRQRVDGAACAHHADHPDKAHAGLEARQRLRDLLRRVLDRCAVAISRRDCLKKTSFHDQSTVDEQHLARHEPTPVRSEKQYRASDVFRSRQAPEWGGGDQKLAKCLAR